MLFFQSAAILWCAASILIGLVSFNKILPTLNFLDKESTECRPFTPSPSPLTKGAPGALGAPFSPDSSDINIFTVGLRSTDCTDLLYFGAYKVAQKWFHHNTFHFLLVIRSTIQPYTWVALVVTIDRDQSRPLSQVVCQCNSTVVWYWATGTPVQILTILFVAFTTSVVSTSSIQ